MPAPQFVLFSLRIDDFDSVNGGGAFVVSVCCVAAICELTFHGQAKGGALHTVSCEQNEKKITMRNH